MQWTGSIRWIHNPVQSRRIWIGLDQKFTNSADPGLDWIQKCAMRIPYLDLRQFLLIATLTSEVLPSNLQIFTSSFVFTCRFYKVFGRYLLCCVRIGLDWIQILVHQLDWTGLGSVARGFGLDWIVSIRSIPYFFILFIYLFISPPPHGFMLSHLREGSCSSARLPALRGSLPRARLPQLESPFRGPGDTGN